MIFSKWSVQNNIYTCTHLPSQALEVARLPNHYDHNAEVPSTAPIHLQVAGWVATLFITYDIIAFFSVAHRVQPVGMLPQSYVLPVFPVWKNSMKHMTSLTWIHTSKAASPEQNIQHNTIRCCDEVCGARTSRPAGQISQYHIIILGFTSYICKVLWVAIGKCWV